MAPAGPRQCDSCAPLHRVYMYFMLARSWSVQFLEMDLKTSVGRIRRFSSIHNVRELIARTPTQLSAEAQAKLEHDISNGRGGIYLDLTPEQYNGLRAAD